MTVKPYSPRELAHAIQDVAPQPLGMLLYNLGRPDECPVWLLPNFETPAHHRAKIGVWPWGDEHIFVQWCVEKGVEGSASALFPPSDVMTPKWAWHDFTRRAASKEFDVRLQDVAKRTPLPLTVRITLGTATPGAGRDYHGVDAQTIVWHVEQNKLIRDDDYSQFGPYNEALPEATSVRAIEYLLTQTQDMPWRWIDFGVGIVLPLWHGTFDVATIWREVLAPWQDWL
ncbi:hypothetical protein [Deinococcus yavapaiensis]|uniref:Uncharacterized protein n=1 Tax=Deinococcus yavapaiensis KR-236 TaxID=694435 RepID=A0A318S4B4_9DEIO|nr:hypothetical protein [Deinococcus yavapaiensis]PYE53276.1 hypothetical protein DES52_10948 [Deinococcus yavapaiensis KR-236]